MMRNQSKSKFFKALPKSTFAILIWLIFTSSLAIWWWIYSLRELQITGVSQQNYSNKHFMIMAEGFILVMMIVLGGSYLLYLVYQDQKRHERIKFFFSAFTHDIKTSISRLRLQSDVLEEADTAANPILRQLAQDIQRLDLQLENSLVLTNAEAPLLIESIALQKIIQIIRQEFPEMNFELGHDISVRADSKALILLLRNIIQNAIIHGGATNISVEPTLNPHQSMISLLISNNGSGYRGNIQKLGREILSSDQSQGNGLGLYIVRNLAEKMGGSVSFIPTNNVDKAFQIDLKLPAQSLRGAS